MEVDGLKTRPHAAIGRIQYGISTPLKEELNLAGPSLRSDRFKNHPIDNIINIPYHSPTLPSASVIIGVDQST